MALRVENNSVTKRTIKINFFFVQAALHGSFYNEMASTIAEMYSMKILVDMKNLRTSE